MENVALVTKALPFQNFLATNVAPTALATLGTTASNPANLSGIIAVNSQQFSNGKFIFFGVGTAAQTFVCQIVGYQPWTKPGSAAPEYVTVVLAEITCTLGATTSAITAANKMVSLITVNSGVVVANYEILTQPTNNLVAMLKLDLQGCEYVRLIPGTGTVTSLNGAMSGF